MRTIDELKEQMIAYDNCLKEDKEVKPLNLTKEEIEEIVDKCVLIPHDVGATETYSPFYENISEVIADNATNCIRCDGELQEEHRIDFKRADEIALEISSPYENYDILIDNTLIVSPIAYHKNAKDFYSVESIVEDIEYEFENLTESEHSDEDSASFDVGYPYLVTETYEAYTRTEGLELHNVEEASKEIVESYYDYVQEDFRENHEDPAQCIATSIFCFDHALKDINPDLRLKDENNENVFKSENGEKAIVEMIKQGNTKPLAEYFNDVSSKVSNEDLVHSAKIFSASFEKMDKSKENVKELSKDRKQKSQIGLGNCG